MCVLASYTSGFVSLRDTIPLDGYATDSLSDYVTNSSCDCVTSSLCSIKRARVLCRSARLYYNDLYFIDLRNTTPLPLQVMRSPIDMNNIAGKNSIFFIAVY